MSQCGKCGNSTFRAQEQNVSGATFKLVFVQCSSCGTPVGVTTFFDPGIMLNQQKNTLQNLESKINRVDSMLQQVLHYVQQRR